MESDQPNPKKTGIKKKVGIGIGIAVGIIFLMGIISFLSYTSNTSVPNQSTSPLTAEAKAGTTAVYTVGENANVVGMLYKVTHVGISDQVLGKYLAQGKFIQAHIIVKNNNSMPTEFYPHQQFVLVTIDSNKNVKLYSDMLYLTGCKTFEDCMIEPKNQNEHELLQPSMPIERDLVFDVPFDNNSRYALAVVPNSQDLSQVQGIDLGTGKDFKTMQ